MDEQKVGSSCSPVDPVQHQVNADSQSLNKKRKIAVISSSPILNRSDPSNVLYESSSMGSSAENSGFILRMEFQALSYSRRVLILPSFTLRCLRTIRYTELLIEERS